MEIQLNSQSRVDLFRWLGESQIKFRLRGHIGLWAVEILFTPQRGSGTALVARA